MVRSGVEGVETRMESRGAELLEAKMSNNGVLSGGDPAKSQDGLRWEQENSGPQAARLVRALKYRELPLTEEAMPVVTDRVPLRDIGQWTPTGQVSTPAGKSTGSGGERYPRLDRAAANIPDSLTESIPVDRRLRLDASVELSCAASVTEEQSGCWDSIKELREQLSDSQRREKKLKENTLQRVRELADTLAVEEEAAPEEFFIGSNHGSLSPRVLSATVQVRVVPPVAVVRSRSSLDLAAAASRARTRAAHVDSMLASRNEAPRDAKARTQWERQRARAEAELARAQAQAAERVRANGAKYGVERASGRTSPRTSVTAAFAPPTRSRLSEARTADDAGGKVKPQVPKQSRHPAPPPVLETATPLAAPTLKPRVPRFEKCVSSVNLRTKSGGAVEQSAPSRGREGPAAQSRCREGPSMLSLGGEGPLQKPLQKDEVRPKARVNVTARPRVSERPLTARASGNPFERAAEQAAEWERTVARGTQVQGGPQQRPNMPPAADRERGPSFAGSSCNNSVVMRSQSWDPAVQPLGLFAKFSKQESAWNVATPLDGTSKQGRYSWSRPDLRNGSKWRDGLRGNVHAEDSAQLRGRSADSTNRSPQLTRSASWDPLEVPTGAGGWTSGQQLRRDRQREQARVAREMSEERVHSEFASEMNRDHPSRSTSPSMSFLTTSTSTSSLRSTSISRPNPFRPSFPPGAEDKAKFYEALLPAPPSEAPPL